MIGLPSQPAIGWLVVVQMTRPPLEKRATMTQPKLQKRRHPGGRKRFSPLRPKGRAVDETALKELRTLLGERPRQRDLLIEYLHLIQDHFGQLAARHLGALAEEMKLSLAEVYEVATFYAHFDVVTEDDVEAPVVTVRVCDSLSCELAGAQKLLGALQDGAPDNVRVVRAPCMGRCDTAPVAEVGHFHVDHASVESVNRALETHTHQPSVGEYIGLASYRAQGGYALLDQCIDGQLSADDVVAILNDSGLRGLGGAGFPTGRKWGIVRSFPGPRLMAVNADEGEPGTFKDRYYLERDPHRFLEGMLIAAWAVEAKVVYIYLRDEYPGVRETLLAELAVLKKEGIGGHTEVVLRRGAGAYICGEESSMLESIEGKRGLPRNRPPYVAEVGIFNKPTLVQNVETLYWIRDVLQRGADWFSAQGRNGGKGFRSYSVSDRVKEPGVKLAPAGITLSELIDEFCGGMLDGHTLKAYLPGGASGGILPATMADLPLEFGQLEQHGCFVGSHAVVVLSDQDDIKAVVLNLLRFFEDESCGQCTPCRVGTEKAVKLMERDVWDVALLKELSQSMTDASICGLGQAAGNPLLSAIKFFPGEVQ